MPQRTRPRDYILSGLGLRHTHLAQEPHFDFLSQKKNCGAVHLGTIASMQRGGPFAAFLAACALSPDETPKNTAPHNTPNVNPRNSITSSPRWLQPTLPGREPYPAGYVTLVQIGAPSSTHAEPEPDLADQIAAVMPQRN
jgi:hypothetical protein